jgi:hypothetical protein
MKRGKQTCKILKEIRKQIAEENDIKLVIEECTYQGDCLGTCPKCEAEVRYLEHELEKRQRLGKAAVFAGMSIGTLLSVAACDTTSKVTEKPLAGDVVAVAPEPDTIIEEPLMGIVAMFRNNYEFGIEEYQSLMKGKFVFPEMKNLSITGGNIEYEKIANGEVCDTFEKLVEAADKFEAPYFSEGEESLLTWLFFQSKVDLSRYNGDMEVAFLVDRGGKVLDVEVQKGIDKALDEEVASFMKGTAWHPAYYQLKDESMRMPFDCRCVLKIHFPIDIEPIPLEGEPAIPIEDLNEKR